MSHTPAQPDPTQNDKALERGLNRSMLGKLAVVVVIMFGFGYAMVPLYKKICEITNINVLNTRDEDGGALRNSQVDK
ncbi:hypothetical protein NLP00_25795, partial [Escherichia coli]|nr:hypothetical protein [Escherichia coli]